MLLHDFLTDSSNRFPDKTGLVCDGKRYSYQQLDTFTNSLARYLLNSGLRKGDRVALYLENGLPAVVGVFGALKAAGAFMMVNPTTKKEKLHYVLKDSQATALILPAKYREWAEEFQLDPELALKISIFVGNESWTDGAGDPEDFYGILSADDGEPINIPIIDVDLAALVYTSGSTGFPKGVTLLHKNMVSAATSITTYLENVHDDIILNVLPLSFDYGLYQVLMAFKFGGRVILEKSFNYPFQIVNKLRDEEVTGFAGVPTIFTILSKLEKVREMDFPSLRYFTNTGAAIPVPVLNSIRELFPNATFYSMYGLTECKRVSYLPPGELDRRPESVGKGMPNEEVYIIRDDGSEAGPHEIGELVVRGSNVMAGYWNDHEATNRVLKAGRYSWEKVLHTGDLFRKDEEGFLYFIGRKDDIIKSRGEKVSPREVENILYGDSLRSHVLKVN